MPLVTFAVTVKLPNVPTDVMLFCDAVVNVPTILVPEILPPVILPTELINPPVIILPPVILAVTANEDSVPTEVILPWAAVVTVPAVVHSHTIQTTF